MIDERAEFAAYTGAVVYDAKNKQDSAYLGRFTFDTLLRGEGLQRVLTIVARGYLWQTEKPDIDRARDALRAWCSIPDSKKAKPKEAWQYETDFGWLRDEFPELVDGQGNGWFVRHVHGVRDFLKHHPEKVSKTALKNLEPLSHGWDRDWRDKVIRFQIPLFSPETKGGWVLRFDDVLTDALELGPLRSPTLTLPPGLEQRLADSFPSAKPEVLLTLLEYYVANKQEDSPWVVLPVASFDAGFGTTAFSKKWLTKIPAGFMERQNQHFGVCRYRAGEEWVEGMEIQWCGEWSVCGSREKEGDSNMIYFTADTHFGHENVIRFCGRPYATAAEMDEALMENWNSRVKGNDTVFILGDLFFRSDNAGEILRRLKGKKRLLVGNHDGSWMTKVDVSRYFASVDLMLELSDGRHALTLCHYPLLTWKHAKKSYMIHGHIHNDTGADFWPLLAARDNVLNAGVDLNGYQPVTFDELLENNRVFKSGG